MTLQLYLAYVAATLAVCLTPGPAVLLASSRGLSGGVRAGALAALGIESVNALYWLIFSLGLGAVIATSEEIFTVLKYAGAAYLVIFGVLTIRNARRAATEFEETKPTPLWRGPYAQGLVTQLANPKTMLFLAVSCRNSSRPAGRARSISSRSRRAQWRSISSC